MTALDDLDVSQQVSSSKWEITFESLAIAPTEISQTEAVGMKRTSWRSIQAP